MKISDKTSMPKASDAHAVLKPFSYDPIAEVENAGIAISLELIRRLTVDSFKAISDQIAHLPSNENFTLANGTKLEILFDASVDVSKVDVEYDNLSLNESNVPLILTKNVKTSLFLILKTPTDQVAEPDQASEPVQAKVGEIEIMFSSIESAVFLKETKLELECLNSEQAGKVTGYWETDPDLSDVLTDDFDFTNKDFSELTTILNAIRLLIPKELAKAYVDSIEMPDILGLFPGVKFENNGRMATKDDFLLFSATSSLNFDQCPVAPVDGTVTVEPNSTGDGVFVPADAPATNYPTISESESTGVGHLFLFAPKELLRLNFEGSAKPAVGFSESGREGIFHWGYKASLILNKFELKLLGGLTFGIEIGLELLGFGDATVKIGCVTHRVAGIAFKGDVDPLRVEFKIDFDFARKEIVFISRIVEVKAKNFDFMAGGSLLAFPINKVVEEILDAAATSTVKSQAGKILVSTRIPVARLGELEKIARLVNALGIHEDSNGDSVTFGAVFGI